VPDIASLAVLSGTRLASLLFSLSSTVADGVVTLHGLPNFTPTTPLAQAKSARTFTTFTTVQHEGPEQAKNKGVAVVVTYLAVGCYRKLVIYSWKDGEHQETVVRTKLMAL
jgi:Vam6/Vps39-like protein vacuolar protein sorting-associated protein 39